jgi:hypothetical protein
MQHVFGKIFAACKKFSLSERSKRLGTVHRRFETRVAARGRAAQ